MSHFDKSGLTTPRGPFGKLNFLRSTKNLHPESYTCSRLGVPTETIDGEAGKRFLRTGEVMAKITSTSESGKIGCFQAGVADGRQTAANIVGLNDTFVPWQLNERDVEIAVHFDCSAVQAWCWERDAGGAAIPLTNTTRDAIVANVSTRLIRFS